MFAELLLASVLQTSDSLLSIEHVRASRASHAHVVVPVTLTLPHDLTVLRFDLLFPPGLCDMLQDPSKIQLLAMGRSLEAPLEEPADCTLGDIDIAVADFLGETAIPSGEGPVLAIDFGPLNPSALPGRFALRPAVTEAGDIAIFGPVAYPVRLEAGELWITP